MGFIMIILQILNDTMILIRNEIVNNPFILYGTIYKLNYNLENRFNQSKYSVLYDSGTVKGYYKF